MSGPLTSKEELEVNYRPLSRALKQLQLKPESPHRKGGMERIQEGEMEREINHGYGESDFRMQKWGENRWGEGDAGTERQGKRQWWRASRRSWTTTLDISLPLCMSRGWQLFLCFTFLSHCILNPTTLVLTFFALPPPSAPRPPHTPSNTLSQVHGFLGKMTSH